ncbi:hypothetical protein WJR50_26740 [Catalinimonas sp. 4WD22]
MSENYCLNQADKGEPITRSNIDNKESGLGIELSGETDAQPDVQSSWTEN